MFGLLHRDRLALLRLQCPNGDGAATANLLLSLHDRLLEIWQFDRALSLLLLRLGAWRGSQSHCSVDVNFCRVNLILLLVL